MTTFFMGDMGEEPKKYRKRRLNSIPAARRFLADLISRVDADVLEPNKAGRMAYMLNILIGSMKESETEKRITDLETRLEEYLRNKNA